MPSKGEEQEDFFEDSSISLFGTEDRLPEPPTHASYGPVTSKIPSMEGKAHIVIAAQIFNSGVIMAEMVELGRIKVAGKRILEFGASTSLPSLLASTFDPPPSSILTTDYPDDLILKTLKENLERNASLAKCPIRSMGHLWGSDTSDLLATLPDPSLRFDLLILSDVIWYDAEHDHLFRSICSTLATDGSAYFTAGHYSKRHIVDGFFAKAESLGFAWEEFEWGGVWEGKMKVDVGVVGDVANLGLRKANVWSFRMWWK